MLGIWTIHMTLPRRYTTTSWQLGRVNGRGTSVSARIMGLEQRPALIQLFVRHLSKCCWCSLPFPQLSDSSAIVVMIETCATAALLPDNVSCTSQLEGPCLAHRYCLKCGWSSQRNVERDLKEDVRTAYLAIRAFQKRCQSSREYVASHKPRPATSPRCSRTRQANFGS